MRIQEYIIDVTAKAAEEFFRYAKAIPVDKLTWSALESGRNALSQCQEIAMCPTWGEHVLGPEPFEAGEGAFEEQYKLMASWDTLEKCEQEFSARFQGFKKVALALSDEDLAKTKFLPFGGGRDHTYAEMMDYVRWNCTYHLGQIAYIQTLYGDKTMY